MVIPDPRTSSGGISGSSSEWPSGGPSYTGCSSSGSCGAYTYTQIAYRTPLEKRCRGNATFPTSSDSKARSSSLYSRMLAPWVYGISVGIRRALGVLAIWILSTRHGMSSSTCFRMSCPGLRVICCWELPLKTSSTIFMTSCHVLGSWT